MLNLDSLKALATEKIMGALGAEAPTPAPAVPPMQYKADAIPSYVWALGAAAVAAWLLFGRKK